MPTEQWATWVAMGMQLADDVRIWCKDLRNSGWNGAGSLAMTTPRQSWPRGPQSQQGWGVMQRMQAMRLNTPAMVYVGDLGWKHSTVCLRARADATSGIVEGGGVHFFVGK